jgi:glycosyltransferase involved in cell wall biosynthesis
MSTISIIIPVYNVELYLNRCIESVLSQTFTDFELILVDDGSPDNSPKMCDEIAQKDSRVVVVHKKNGGLSSARNAGLDIAKGEYVFFIDSDDLISLLGGD